MIQRANELRATLGPRNKPIDPEQALDLLSEKISGFEWFVGDEFFEGMNDVLAYAKFDNGRHIFLSERLYEDLGLYGTQKYERAAFVVAHEIGHAILHFRTRKSFARNGLGSPENYRSDKIRETEANIFAASFLIPTESIDTDISAHTISQHFKTSKSVAAGAIREARLVQTYMRRGQ